MITDMSIPTGFAQRHIGPGAVRCEEMLEVLGCATLDELIDEAVPEAIRLEKAMVLPEAQSESGALD